MQQLNGLLHRAHGGGHEGRQTHEARTRCLHALEHRLGCHVATQVVHAIAVVLKQHFHDILADVVDVALHGGKHDVALVLSGARRHARLHGVEAHLDRLGRGHELGQEELATLELGTHLVEHGDKAAVDDLQRVATGKKFAGHGLHLCLAPGEDEVTCTRQGVRAVGEAGGHVLRCASTRRHGRTRACSTIYLRILRGRPDSPGPTRLHGSRRIVGVRSLGVALDEDRRALVLGVEHALRGHHVAHAARLGVHDGQVEPGGKGLREEHRVNHLALGQAEADVGHAQHAAHAELLVHETHGTQDLRHLALVGGGRHGEAVDDHVLPRDARLLSCLHDAARDGEAPLGRLGDAVLVERKAHDGATVVRGDGQHGLERLGLAVHGVDEGLACIAAHGAAHGLGVGGVNLQRQVAHGLNALHDLHEHAGLIELRQAHIDVECIGTEFCLVKRLTHRVVEVTRTQGLLEALLARGIDALADNVGVGLACLHDQRLLCAAHGKGMRVAALRGHRGARAYESADAGDVVRRGAAAATHNGGTRVEQGLGCMRVGLGVDVVEGTAVLDARQARVRLHHEGHAGKGRHAREQGCERVGAQRAVDAHSLHAQRRQRHGADLGTRAQEGAAVLAERHGGHHGQLGALKAGKHRRLSLEQVGHGLDDEEVGAGSLGGTGLLGKEVVRLVKVHGAQGLEQSANGADVGSHVAGARLARARDGGCEHVLHAGGVAQLVSVGTERVGRDDVGTRLHIGAMDGRDGLGMREVEQLGQLAGLEARLLQHGAHRPVEHEELLAGEDATQEGIGCAEAVGRHGIPHSGITQMAGQRWWKQKSVQAGPLVQQCVRVPSTVCRAGAAGRWARCCMHRTPSDGPWQGP